MRLAGSWLLELRRLGFGVAAGGLVGWIFDRPLQGMALVMVAYTGYWLYQLLRVQRWLANPGEAPPEGRGIWGEVYDQIYHLQRRNRESRDRLQSTVDYLQDSFAALRDGIVLVNEEGGIAWNNNAAQDLLGLQYPRDQGQALLNLVRIPEFNKYYLAGNFAEPLVIRLGGETLQVLQFEVTLFGAGDRLIFVRDVTKMARLEQMRRDFVGNVSHELRTPLTVIKGYLDTMLGNSERLDPHYIRPLEQMTQQTVRMENLLKDLLWLSRIESVRSHNQHQLLDMCGMLKELQEELKSSYPERKVELLLESEQRVRGDHKELYSAVSNLVLNAIKYSADATVVTVSWRQQGEQLILSVKDRGIGIAESHLPRVTERFYRVDDSRSSKTGGTGLGLAIVKHVAAAHRASLHIDSQLGQGSVFSLVFPAS